MLKKEEKKKTCPHHTSVCEKRWTAGKQTEAILSCLFLTIYEDISCPFSSHFMVIYPPPFEN